MVLGINFCPIGYEQLNNFGAVGGSVLGGEMEQGVFLFAHIVHCVGVRSEAGSGQRNVLTLNCRVNFPKNIRCPN